MNVNEMYNPQIFFKRLMEISGLKTQKEIADKFVLTERKVSSWHGKIPSIHDLLSIAYEYHCSIDYLLGMDSVETLATKQYSARDVCRILTVLDKQYGLEMIKEEENLNQDDINDKSDEYLSCEFKSRAAVSLKFPAHCQYVGENIEFDENGNVYNTIPEYNHSGVYINIYLSDYIDAKKGLSSLNEAMRDKVYELMIDEVPADMPPSSSNKRLLENSLEFLRQLKSSSQTPTDADARENV